MMIFHQRVERSFTGTAAHGKNGKFALEADKFFEDQWRGRKITVDFCDVVETAQYPLTFAVIAEPSRLQNAGQSQLAYGRVQLARGIEGNKLGSGNVQFLEQRLFAEAILRGFKCLGRRIYRQFLGEVARRFDRYVFKFVSDQSQAMSESIESFEIGVFGSDARRDAAHGGLR